ncbi:flagellar biosynthetic protein FliR [Gynuella sp.]|uniref:flagellar biosynthetic protein FliR n=1 Tax=Gynuella sp. TaxID=2969146 RepID=UPI003D1283B6
MNIEVAESSVIAVFLAFVRIGAFLLFVPVFNFVRLPLLIRVFFSLTMALFLMLNVGFPTLELTPLGLISAIGSEVINGSAMAFGMLAAFAVFHFAGRVLDFQMGFGVAGLIDPTTQVQSPLIGTVLNLLAAIVFILAGGISAIFRSLALSLENVPPGQPFSLQNAEWFMAHAGLIFTLSVALAAPVLLAIFLLDILMAFAGRTMPQMNVFIISIPFKITLGMVVIATTIVSAQPIFRKVFNAIFEFWEPFF